MSAVLVTAIASAITTTTTTAASATIAATATIAAPTVSTTAAAAASTTVAASASTTVSAAAAAAASTAVATATVSAAAAAAAAAAPTTTTARTTVFTGTSFVDHELATLEVSTVQCFDHSFAVFADFHEGEPSRLTGHPIHHHIDRCHRSVLFDSSSQIIDCRLERQIADKETTVFESLELAFEKLVQLVIEAPLQCGPGCLGRLDQPTHNHDLLGGMLQMRK